MFYDTQHDARLSITQSDNDELNKREISSDRNRTESKKLANRNVDVVVYSRIYRHN